MSKKKERQFLILFSNMIHAKKEFVNADHEYVI